MSFSTGGSGSYNSQGMSYIIAAVLLLLGVVLLKEIATAQMASMFWTSTKGMVTGNTVECRKNSCNAYIDYVYEADGGQYSYSRVEVLRNNLFGGKTAMKNALSDRYPRGRTFNVFYNPKQPSKASLGSGNIPNPAMPMLFIFLAVVIFYKKGD